MADQPTPELSERELEILRLVATGAGNKEIAQKLVISSNTVKVHLRNIFTKIGAASRTEAAMYAVRIGLVITPNLIEKSNRNGNENKGDEKSFIPISDVTGSSLGGDQSIEGSIDHQIELFPKRRLLTNPKFVASILVILVFFSAGSIWFLRTGKLSPSSNPPNTASTRRTQILSTIPAAREDFGVAAYENQIYTIAGKDSNGVTGTVERFDPHANSWIELSRKPVPVSDVNAGMIGGLIFVPGGRLASGKITNVMEAYDPKQDRWEMRAPLPIAICGYAMVVYEGRLFVFGGWDGEHYLDTVYEYDPSQNMWTHHSPMPTARAYSAAALSQGKIYVFGGYDGKQILNVNEVYFPDQDTNPKTAWSSAKPLPEPRQAMGATSLADLIFIFGGKGNRNQPLRFIQFRPQDNEWQQLEGSFSENWSDMGFVGLGTQIYIIGGELKGQLTQNSLSYQAIYTISIPLVP